MTSPVLNVVLTGIYYGCAVMGLLSVIYLPYSVMRKRSNKNYKPMQSVKETVITLAIAVAGLVLLSGITDWKLQDLDGGAQIYSPLTMERNDEKEAMVRNVIKDSLIDGKVYTARTNALILGYEYGEYTEVKGTMDQAIEAMLDVMKSGLKKDFDVEKSDTTVSGKNCLLATADLKDNQMDVNILGCSEGNKVWILTVGNYQNSKFKRAARTILENFKITG